MRPSPELTFEMPPAKKPRGRKPDPYRYLKRMGDTQRSTAVLRELQDRSIKVRLATRAWSELPAWKRALLWFVGVDPVSFYEGHAE
jgi:hypothetical protein